MEDSLNKLVNTSYQLEMKCRRKDSGGSTYIEVGYNKKVSFKIYAYATKLQVT